MTGQHNSSGHSQPPRRDKMYEEHVQDPYVARGKYREPTVCPDCQASFHDGHWQWSPAPATAQQHRCPACQRTHDQVPAAQLQLSGEFFTAHRDEIIHLLQNLESKEKAEHALERIMDINEQEDTVIIRYTGRHLPRASGEALRHAYKGDLDYHDTDKDDVLRIKWQR